MYYHHVVGLRGLLSAVKGKTAKTPILLEMKRPDVRHPFYLRVPSTDVSAFEQIFIHQEYDFEVSRPPRVIVDAGANVGLASIYFANRFPDARVIAIEPEASNFEVLQKNVLPYGNIVPLRAALWHENRRINLVDPALGHWGFMTQAGEGEASLGRMLDQVQGMTIDRIMADHGIDHIDILKIDVEGAEREVFRDPTPWLDQVDALIVELHERLKPGCNRAFYNGTTGFDQEWWQGENVYLARNHGCLTRRAP
ncbi:MAG TPA: FkbM family methyltransferase [Rhodocyclaceae bacterium]|nr:FkbM family methyltransferase [Rhodocyclaceae bacterium]